MQNTYWRGAGITALASCDLDNWTLLEEPSEYALPRLSEQNATFDFIFIDGWHTLDHGLIDAFYATRMLRVGGYLLLDDTTMPGLWKLARYLMNYPCFALHSEVPSIQNNRVLRSTFWRDRSHLLPGRLARFIDMPRMVVLKKIVPDERPWDWYERF